MSRPAAALPHDPPPPPDADDRRNASRPWRRGLGRALSSSLAAAILIGVADVILTLKGAADVSSKQALAFGAIILSLYGAVGLLVGLVEGAIAGGMAVTHPRGTIKRLWATLVDDPELDVGVTAGIIAAGLLAICFIEAAAILAMRLVAQPERKSVGALLLGAGLVGALPIFALLFYPIFRAARPLARLVPRLGSLPRAVLLVALVAFGGVALVLLYVFTKLDWRVLPMAVPVTAAAFVVAQLGFLAAFRRMIPRWGTAVAALAAALAPVITIATIEPDERTVALLSLEARGGRTLVAVARSLFDRDGDGYSTILGGGDCDDHNPDIHPGAVDIPDNGIDENCIGGDAHKDPEPPVALPSVLPGANPETLAGQFHWKGNIVVIAVDTLRADRLGVAGYTKRGGKSLTPRIDGLADAGVYFKHVYAQAPNTPRSFPSMFTSRYPSKVKWDNVFRNYSNLTAEAVTVWEALRAAELHTVGESSHFYFTEERGITKGFDEYDNEGAKNIKDSNHDSAAPRIAPRAEAKIADLAKKKTRFALFVHFFEPHSTYMEHPEFPIQGKGLEGLEEKYDYEIAFVDKYVGEIQDAVKAAGIADDTIIVLLSDHGEAFGAHSVGGEKMYFHGQTLYDELLRVPLVFVIPGVPHRVVDEPVMLLDLAPTLVDAVKGKIPPSFQGRSLLPAILGETLPPRAVHAELLPAPEWNHDAKTEIDPTGRWKMIYRISDNLFELYDLSVDPTEQKNLIHDDKKQAEAMKHDITKWMESGL